MLEPVPPGFLLLGADLVSRLRLLGPRRGAGRRARRRRRGGTGARLRVRPRAAAAEVVFGDDVSRASRLLLHLLLPLLLPGGDLGEALRPRDGRRQRDGGDG